MILKDYKKNIISDDLSIRDTLIRLDNLGTDLTLFVVGKDGKLIGAVTDGDIRRALINYIDINQSILECTNMNCCYLRENEFSIEEVKAIKSRLISVVPVIDYERYLKNIININDTYSLLPVDAIVMAGGRGERLRPFTDTVPKPLLKVGGIPIIERNIDRLKKFGINHITVALKYLGEQIEDYLGNGFDKQIEIKYVNEEIPLGTLGAAKLVEEFFHDELLIMNSDLLTNIDLEQMYIAFKENDADMVIASTSYEVNVPYAVLETQNGEINSFREKPTYSYHSNAGIYMIKKEVLNLIPKNEFYNATDLIDDLIKAGKKVMNFPILDYWLDIGKHEDFEKAQQDIERIKF